MTLPTLKITVGRLWVRPIRDYLKHAQFADPRIEWIETGGWIEKTFSVRAPQECIEEIIASYKAWVAQTEPT